MRSYCHRLVALLLVCAPLASAAELNRVSPEQVQHWIDQLDHDDFAVRELAAGHLAQSGVAAIQPLAEGVISQNPEVAWRSSEILERMAMEGDEATMDRVVNVLGELAKRGKPGLAQFASQMRERQKTFKHNRAATELRKLGGQVAGGFESVAEVPADFIFAAEPALEAMEMVEIEDDLEIPAVEEPAALGIMRALGMLRRPDLEGDDMPGAEAVEKAPPAFGERVAAGIFPGKIGAALRRALGKVEAKAIDAMVDPLLPHDVWEDLDFADEAPTDFRLPSLDEEVDWAFEDLAVDEIFPGEDVEGAMEGGIAMDEIEVADAGIIVLGGPAFFGGGMMMMGDGSVSPGALVLGREWRGGDSGLKHLKDLNGVASLQIDHAELSDAALAQIAKMSSLKHLQIRGGKFSREALHAFHRQKPAVSIMAMGEGMMGVNAAFNAEGCVLDTVFPGSAAHEAGLKAGDKVVAIEGDPVGDFSDLTISVSTRKPGEKLKVAIERGGERQELELTLKERPAGQ